VQTPSEEEGGRLVFRHTYLNEVWIVVRGRYDKLTITSWLTNPSTVLVPLPSTADESYLGTWLERYVNPETSHDDIPRACFGYLYSSFLLNSSSNMHRSINSGIDHMHQPRSLLHFQRILYSRERHP